VPKFRVLCRVVDFNYVCNLFITFARKYCAIVLLLLGTGCGTKSPSRKKGAWQGSKDLTCGYEVTFHFLN